MSNSIVRFDTIASHDERITQSSSTIKCLADVLKYILEVLQDDQTSEINTLLTNHMLSKGTSSHTLNVKLLSDELMNHIWLEFVNKQEYTGTRDEFIIWLMTNPAIYTTEIPTISPDKFTTGLTFRVVDSWLSVNHDTIPIPHNGMLNARIAALNPERKPAPRLRITPEVSAFFPYYRGPILSYSSMVSVLEEYLVAQPPTRPIMNYSSPDNALSETQELLSYFTEYGEEAHVVYRKYFDYYTNHSAYFEQDWMDASDISHVSSIRANVNSDFCKSIHLFGNLDITRSAIYIACSADFKTDIKTLDLINIVGLRSSIVCVSIVPYMDVVLKNRVVVTFNNYDQDYTYTLIEDLHSKEFKVVITLDKEEVKAYVFTREYANSVVYSTIGMTKIIPQYLLISPKIAYPKNGTIRIHDIRLFADSLNDNEVLATTDDRQK